MEFHEDIEKVLEQLKKVNKNLYEYWREKLYYSGTGWDNWNQYTLYRMRQGLDSFRILNSI